MDINTEKDERLFRNSKPSNEKHLNFRNSKSSNEKHLNCFIMTNISELRKGKKKKT